MSLLDTFLLKEKECLQLYSGFNPGNNTYCNATHDGLLCWPPALAGSEVKQNCPPFQGLNPNNFAYRTCGENASWENIISSIITIGKTNFAKCMLAERNMNMDTEIPSPLSVEFKESAKIINIVGICLLSISLLCVITVLLLYNCVLPKFVNEILHVRIHKHLYFSITMDAMVKLTSQSIVLFQLQHPDTPINFTNIPFLCELLTTLNQYAELTFLAWGALDSHFVQITSKSGYLSGSGYMIYCVVGWALPLVPVTVWVVTLAVHHKVKCWRNYTSHPVVWIVEIPKLGFMVITITMLFISVWRINKEFYKKKIFHLHNLKSEIVMTSAFSFIIFISVLLVMVPMHAPLSSSLETQHVATIFTSSRGLFVSFLYAFINRNFWNFLRHNETRLPCKKYLRII